MGSQRQCLPQRRSSVSILVPQIGNQAALTYAALLTPSLLPTTGLVFRGMDGVATAVPPAAQIVRFNFGASDREPGCFNLRGTAHAFAFADHGPRLSGNGWGRNGSASRSADRPFQFWCLRSGTRLL